MSDTYELRIWADGVVKDKDGHIIAPPEPEPAASGDDDNDKEPEEKS